MTDVAVIIVNYNTKEILRECLDNLKKLGLSGAQILVVDNGSGDDSPEMVRTHFPEVTLIEAENKGLAAGYNLGIKNARDCGYYLFLGTDSFPTPGCLEGVESFLEQHEEAGAATAKLLLRDKSLDMDAHRGFPTPWAALTHFAGLDKIFKKSTIFNRYFLGWKNFGQPHEIDLGISHFLMIKKEVFDKIGFWDEDYFVYGEDVDLCWRIKEAGYKIFYLPQFECLHYKGVSVGIRKESADVTKADEATKAKIKGETTKAMRLFYRKHMYKKYPWALNKVVELGIGLMEFLRKV